MIKENKPANQSINTDKDEFERDLGFRRNKHLIMNFHYLMYKGIQILNKTLSTTVLETLGLAINVPRTFMTIEAIRPELNKRKFDISVTARNKKERTNGERSAKMLKGEWSRMQGNGPKADAEFNALVFGTGYLLKYFCKDEVDGTIYDGKDADGKIKQKKGKTTRYEGMKVKSLNPYYVIPDRKARTYEPGHSNSPRHIWVISNWDFDVWKKFCEQKGYKTDGMAPCKIEEYDAIRNEIDAIYTYGSEAYRRTIENNQVYSNRNNTTQNDNDNSIRVIEKFTDEEYVVYSGNFFENHREKNQHADKRIPIYAIKDYSIPDELDGIGEPEVLRWQQYEENKIHNLTYLQVLLNTVKRYGIMEELLQDPTEVKMNNPLIPIRLKYMPGQNVKVSDAVQVLDQHNSSDIPLKFLEHVKGIGQSATGQNDYTISASKSQADTLGEAKMLKDAGNNRVVEKIIEMEGRDLVPLLISLLADFPIFYTESLDLLLNDNEKYVKYLPYPREINQNATWVANFAVKEGVMDAKTVEEVFLKSGYKDVVFVDDIIGSYDIEIKTVTSYDERLALIGEYKEAIASCQSINNYLISIGKTPKFDVEKLTEEYLRQFPEVIGDIDDYILEENVASTMTSMAQPIFPNGQPKPEMVNQPAQRV